GNELHHFLIDFVLFEIGRGDAVLRRQKLGDLAVGDVTELGERGAEVLAGALLLVLSLAKLLQADQFFADEQLAQAVDVRHWRENDPFITPSPSPPSLAPRGEPAM